MPSRRMRLRSYSNAKRPRTPESLCVHEAAAPVVEVQKRLECEKA